jgi:hypothetical protein
VKLPTTETEIRNLAKGVCDYFGFTDIEHATFVICQAINHMPRDVGWAMSSHFAECIRRSLSGAAAAKLGQSLSGDLQVRELKQMFTQDPTNQQIRDEIQKLADRGLEAAKRLLKEIGG